MDRYRLERYPFALTPTSVVHVCTDLITGERLAVKILDRRTASGERRVQRLLHGVQMLSRAGSHVGIVDVRGAYEVDEKMFLVMEYVAGGSLLNYINRRGPLREVTAVVVVRQLLEALAHLHGFGIMHRDVKVDNILIRYPTDCKGPPTNVCLCDFGFTTNKAHNTECVGSPQYSAPELALIGLTQGRPHAPDVSYDLKCDIWSLGVVTYVILSGLLPFDGNTVNEVFSSVTRCNVPFVHAVWKNVSDDAKNFILFLMTPDPERRPTAREALGHSWLV